MAKVVILKMCPPSACPRIIINGERVVFRDDYNKKGFLVGSKLLGKLQTL